MSAEDKYRVVQKIDSGGMAEVFRAEAEGIEGFKKEVAIKRVLPHLAENKKFIDMFLDEARLSLRMNHGNVVQVFDIGVADNTYFIVMEFVNGTNLKTVLNYYRQRGMLLNIEHSVYIIMKVLDGLNYAHNLNNSKGESLNIVHRDVSPPNILLSKEGAVKIVDFGLAKATSQLEHTDPGVVKGKFSYLSPEAAWGEEVDHRADIFSAGIILFELLTGKRLFWGETDLQTVELVRRANIPSIRRLNPHVAQDLEDVVRRSLARDRDNRYQTAYEFGDDLANILFSRGLKVTTFDVAKLVKDMIQEDESRRRRAEPSMIDRLIQEEMLRFTSIDEAGRPSSGSNSTPEMEDSTGSAPLDVSDFEDPRAWMDDFGVKTGIDQKAAQKEVQAVREEQEKAEAPSPEPQQKQEKPSGQHTAIEPGTLETTLEGEAQVPIQEASSDRAFRALKIIFLAVAAMGIGAAAAALALGLYP